MRKNNYKFITTIQIGAVYSILFFLQSLELFILLQSPSHLCSSLASFLLYVYVFSTMVLLCVGRGVVFGSKGSETLYQTSLFAKWNKTEEGVSKTYSQPDYYIFIPEQPRTILSFLRLISSEAIHFSVLARPFSFIFRDDKDSTAQENKRASTRITNWSLSMTQITFIIVNFLFKHQNRIVHKHIHNNSSSKFN